MKKVGIYVHIPFCMQKCKYCDFVSFKCIDDKVDEYFNFLELEIIENTKKLKLEDNNEQIEIDTIYIGGGTPSALSLKEIEYYVGMPIDAALAELGIITTRIYKTGFYFCGWKQNKSSETFIKSLPPYGTLYAIWQSTGNQGGGSGGSTDMQEPIVTFDFNGGTLDGKSSMTFDYDDLKYSMGSSTISVFAFLGLEHPTKSGYTFLGWSTNSNATSPEYNSNSLYTNRRDITLYAIWTKVGNAVTLPENPKTGIMDYLLPLGGTAGVSGAGLAILKRKRSFKQF